MDKMIHRWFIAFKIWVRRFQIDLGIILKTFGKHKLNKNSSSLQTAYLYLQFLLWNVFDTKTDTYVLNGSEIPKWREASVMTSNQIWPESSLRSSAWFRLRYGITVSQRCGGWHFFGLTFNKIWLGFVQYFMFSNFQQSLRDQLHSL